jgi:hypothetical protein
MDQKALERLLSRLPLQIPVGDATLERLRG